MTNDKSFETDTTHPAITQEALAHLGDGHIAYVKEVRSEDVATMFPARKLSAKIIATEHHLAHASSAFFPSPYERAAVVTVDGAKVKNRAHRATLHRLCWAWQQPAAKRELSTHQFR